MRRTTLPAHVLVFALCLSGFSPSRAENPLPETQMNAAPVYYSIPGVGIAKFNAGTTREEALQIARAQSVMPRYRYVTRPDGRMVAVPSDMSDDDVNQALGIQSSTPQERSPWAAGYESAKTGITTALPYAVDRAVGHVTPDEEIAYRREMAASAARRERLLPDGSKFDLSWGGAILSVLLGLTAMAVLKATSIVKGPTPQPVRFSNAWSLAWGRLTDYSGRSSRSEYWWFILATGLVTLVLGYIYRVSEYLPFWAGAYLATMAATFPPYLALTVRRLHDTDRSGAWYLLSFVPWGWLIVYPVLMGRTLSTLTDSQESGLLILMIVSLLGCCGALIYFMVSRGDVGENSYGHSLFDSATEAGDDERFNSAGAEGCAAEATEDTPQTKALSQDDAFRVAGEEVLNGNVEPRLWAHALVSGGDNDLAVKAAYVRARVAQLT